MQEQAFTMANACPVPGIRPEEPSTLDQMSWGIGLTMIGSGFVGEFSDWFRIGKTIVPPKVVGKGINTPVKTTAVKGGGVNPKTGFKLPFHYHIHKYNWYKPWQWFKYTPMK